MRIEVNSGIKNRLVQFLKLVGGTPLCEFRGIILGMIRRTHISFRAYSGQIFPIYTKANKDIPVSNDPLFTTGLYEISSQGLKIGGKVQSRTFL
jgi:hypothetical protein